MIEFYSGARPLTDENGPLAAYSWPPTTLSSPCSNRAAIPVRMKSKPVRALIVDDEPVARRVLREELESQPGLEIVGEAESGVSALEEIAALEPDLVFLDLQMPEMGGFEVIQQLHGGTHVPVIIVVTAYDQYAIKAFDAGAIDYLLKPVSDTRLVQSLERARKLIGNRAQAAENLGRLQEIAGPPATAQIQKIVGRLGDEYILLNASEVMAFQADGEVVWIVTAKQRYLATQSLRKIQAKLASSSFRRIHRNALVNVDHVRKMSALTSNRWLITLHNNQEFVVSKRMARNVRQILSW
jgi:two-component system LytT family response regulator